MYIHRYIYIYIYIYTWIHTPTTNPDLAGRDGGRTLMVMARFNRPPPSRPAGKRGTPSCPRELRGTPSSGLKSRELRRA